MSGWARALPVLVGVFAAAGPLHAQAPLASRPPDLPHGYLGMTRCLEGRPVSTIDPYLDSISRVETEAHEAVHRRQLATDCEGRLRLIERDPQLRLAYEVDGYCGGLVALGLDPMRQGAAVERLRQALYDLFLDVSFEAIDGALSRSCP